MTAFPLVLAIVALQSPGADSLRLLAQGRSGSELVLETRARPYEVREAVAEGMARAVRFPASATTELAATRRLAVAYALAWRDSFFLREVDRFAAWPGERRAAKVRADSVRRAGVSAYSRDGPQAAIALWRRALAGSMAIGDSAGVAAVLGNIGAGFLVERVADSAGLYLERARVAAAAVGDARVEANALGLLAGVSEERGDLAAARDRYSRAMALRERTGDRRGLAADHNNLGLLAQRLGDQDEARRHFEAALDINRRDGRDAVAATNLVNLAGIATLEGDFGRAEALYRDAIATWRPREAWTDVAAALHGLGQLELRRGDYPAARSVLVEAQTIYDRTGPVVEAIAVRRTLAGALGAAGNLQGAVDLLRRAQDLADSAKVPPGVRADLILARADLAFQLNDFAEAERLYLQAEGLYGRAADPAGQAEAQSGRGVLLLERGEAKQAQSLLTGAMRTQSVVGNMRAAALTRISLGYAAQAAGDMAGATRQFTRAAEELSELGDPVGAAAALEGRAALEAEAGRWRVADSLYRAGLGRLADRIAPDIAWRLHAGLGNVEHARGSPDRAVRELRAAISEVERSGRSLRLAERRSAFLSDKWEVYARLALFERERNRPGSAFDASERLRAREMLEMLMRGRIGAPSDTAAALLGRAQDLQHRMAELVRDPERAPSGPVALRGPSESPGDAQRREALTRAQDAYATVLLDMRDRAPAQASLLTAEPASWQDVARRLEGDEVFIEYLLSDSASLAFVVRRDTLAVVDLGVGRPDLARLVELARGTLESRGSVRGDSLWRSPLRRLHEYLIAPIDASGLLAGAKRLIFVPHAELHYLPFAALLDPGSRRYLVQRFELAQTPSASVWLALGNRRKGRASAGALALAPRPDALPASLGEVRAIARLTGSGTTVLTGAAASESAFRREAPSRRVLHLAGYGVLNKQNPLFSYVEFGPDAAHDGRLEVHEVFGLDLAADLIVLSACQTALGSGALADVPAGDDWVGLSRAFLHAGAARVVATLWSVEDRATGALMEEFYRGLAAGAEPERALAEAQRELLRLPATGHPFHWAGFVVVGGAR